MKLFDRFRRSRQDIEAEDSRSLVRDLEATPIAEVTSRARCRVAGEVRAVTYPAHGATPSFAARLDDGTGSLLLVFLGREQVPGVTAGRRLVAEGMVTEIDGLTAIYNPKLELLTGTP